MLCKQSIASWGWVTNMPEHTDINSGLLGYVWLHYYTLILNNYFKDACVFVL